MAVIRDGTEGANNIPSLAALGALLCLIFVVLGIKFKGFKHRLIFERLPTEPVRRDVRENMVKVTGVYRIRNLDEDEINRPISLPPVKLKQTEDLFSAYKDKNSASNSPVVLRNDKSAKPKDKVVASKDVKTKKSPAPVKVDKAAKEKSPKITKAPKTPPQVIAMPTSSSTATPPKSPKSANISPKLKDKPTSSSTVTPPKSPKSANISPKLKDKPTSSSTAAPPKSPKSAKTSPKSGDMARKMTQSEPALNKAGTPSKEKTSFWSGWFSSSKELKIATPVTAPKKEKKPEKPVPVKKEKPTKEKKIKAEKPVEVKKEKPAKEKKLKPEKPVKEKKEKLQKKDIVVSTVKVVNAVPTPQPRSTITNKTEATDEIQPRGLPTKSPKSGSRKTVVADVEPNEPSHGILQFVETTKPPQSPDDDFGAWDMVNEHRKSITQTAAMAAQVKPPPHDTSLRLKDNTAGLLTKPKTMREMKKLSKETAELKMRRSAESAEAEA